jgi:hypothetical protein
MGVVLLLGKTKIILYSKYPMIFVMEMQCFLRGVIKILFLSLISHLKMFKFQIVVLVPKKFLTYCHLTNNLNQHTGVT